MSRCTGKYLNSPLNRGCPLWDKLPRELQKSESVTIFVKELCSQYNSYQDLLRLELCCYQWSYIDDYI